MRLVLGALYAARHDIPLTEQNKGQIHVKSKQIGMCLDSHGSVSKWNPSSVMYTPPRCTSTVPLFALAGAGPGPKCAPYSAFNLGLTLV